MDNGWQSHILPVCRYLAICHPMRKHLLTSRARAVFTVMMIWPLAAAFGAVVPVFSVGLIEMWL